MSALSRRIGALAGEQLPLLIARLVSRLLLGALAIFLVFFALQTLVPADPAATLAGPGARADQIAAARTQLALDASLPEQLARYAVRLSSGDLGRSQHTGNPVLDDLRAVVPASSSLLGAASAAALAVGLLVALLGVSGWLGSVPMLGLIIAGSIPLYAVTAFLVLGEGRLAVLTGADALAHMAMPVIALALPAAYVVARAARGGLAAAMRQPYVRAARASGSSVFGAALQHGLRNALRQPLAAIGAHVSVMIVSLLAVERLFALQGIGTYLLDAIAAQDEPASLGACMVIAALYLLLDVALAVVRTLIDPQLRLE